MIRRLAGLAVSVAAVPAVLLGLPALSPESFASPAGITAQPAPDALSGGEVAATAFRAGFRGQALVTMVAIAGAESSWSPGAEGDTQPIHSCECHSHGLWQIRSCPKKDPQVTYDTGGCHPPLDRGDRSLLIDPDANAAAAWQLASGGGGGFDNWSTYTSGAYTAWLPQAEAVAAAYATATVNGGT
jgi:Lysozyme like domain